MGKLTAKGVAKLLANTVIGNHFDGAGLRLEIKGPKAASWTATYQIDGVVKSMGLGSARTFGLAEARERCRKLVRQPLADAVDPLAVRRAERAARMAAIAKAITFNEAASSFIAGNASSWGNPAHAQQWTRTLETYVTPIIGALSVADVDVTHVLKILEQHVTATTRHPGGTFWEARRETASRVRGRIEMILDWATARRYRTGDNPAAWKTVGKVLPARGKIAVVHHDALPFAEMPAFTAALRLHRDVAAQALLFTILTAARTNEVLGARWGEIDRYKKLWKIPASRMKAGEAHTVPLAQPVLDLLDALPRSADSDFVFLGRNNGAGLAAKALRNALVRTGHASSVHGFRSAFRDWAAECTNFQHEICEMALAHRVGDASTLAYRRTKYLPKRQQLMTAWATFCMTAPAAATGDNVLTMGGSHGRR
jgi:integrase